MNILVSNDDGYQAPGIQALAKALAPLGDVYVVAPIDNKSAASSSLTVGKGIKTHHIEKRIYAVDGTPSDCVHLALTGMLQNHIDLVVTGVNSGANLGDDVIYSGTVAGAIEGRFLGLPSIAVSLASWQGRHFASAAKVAYNIVKNIGDALIDNSTILNINVPDVPYQDLKGLQTTRLGKRHPSENSYPDHHDETLFFIGENGKEADNGEGTDFFAINAGYVSLTPLQIDLTHYQEMPMLDKWLQSFSLT